MRTNFLNCCHHKVLHTGQNKSFILKYFVLILEILKKGRIICNAQCWKQTEDQERAEDDSQKTTSEAVTQQGKKW